MCRTKPQVAPLSCSPSPITNSFSCPTGFPCCHIPEKEHRSTRRGEEGCKPHQDLSPTPLSVWVTQINSNSIGQVIMGRLCCLTLQKGKRGKPNKGLEAQPGIWHSEQKGLSLHPSRELLGAVNSWGTQREGHSCTYSSWLSPTSSPPKSRVDVTALSGCGGIKLHLCAPPCTPNSFHAIIRKGRWAS